MGFIIPHNNSFMKDNGTKIKSKDKVFKGFLMEISIKFK